jgi:cysteine-rich repeat protein
VAKADEPPPGGAVCGDGILDVGEECDDGNTVSGDGCSSVCVIEFCGDGIVQAGLGEQCDDGNTIAGDGCSPTCQFEQQAAIVEIDRADWSRRRERIDVRGTVTPPSNTVDVFAPGTQSGNTCMGTQVATVAQDEAGAFSFRSARGAFPDDPLTVCVQADVGGAAQRATRVRR